MPVHILLCCAVLLLLFTAVSSRESVSVEWQETGLQRDKSYFLQTFLDIS